MSHQRLVKKTGKVVRFIDLFAGLGGTRIGFEQACQSLELKSQCVFTSEIKPYAREIYSYNFKNEKIAGDITQINETAIPHFDYLLAGFPCQAFSSAGKKHGFLDTRGTLFFDIARIIKVKKPKGFLLENVEGLVTHDRQDRKNRIGNTLNVILSVLKELGYQVSWKVLDAKDFGVPQKRRRIYIVGHLDDNIDLSNFEKTFRPFRDIKEHGLKPLSSKFTKRLLELYRPEELSGKAIKDKRGGENNIHSWDLELRGKINKDQKKILSELLKQRRRKDWAIKKGIQWMDGMPLTLDEIHSFSTVLSKKRLSLLLDDLVQKSYLRFEYPKDLVFSEDGKKYRSFDESKPKGYNLVTGKLSFELNKILDDDSIAPTIVATEADRIGVLDQSKIRRISERECLRLFGFPEWYSSNISHQLLYDLIGNTVVVPVVNEVAKRLLCPKPIGV